MVQAGGNDALSQRLKHLLFISFIAHLLDRVVFVFDLCDLSELTGKEVPTGHVFESDRGR